MKIEKLNNGALYWNTVTERVERVVGKLNSRRAFTVSHGYSELKPVPVTFLDKANGQQVRDYLAESKQLKSPVQLATPQLPPLPDKVCLA